MPEKDLKALFLHQLKDIYYAENAILRALPKMMDAARSGDPSTTVAYFLVIADGLPVRRLGAVVARGTMRAAVRARGRGRGGRAGV
jgi:hypothetical protein